MGKIPPLLLNYYVILFFLKKNNSHISKQLFIKPSKHIICTGGRKG